MLRRVASLVVVTLGLASQVVLADNPINPGFPYGSQKGMFTSSPVPSRVLILHVQFVGSTWVDGWYWRYVLTSPSRDVSHLAIPAMDHAEFVRQHRQREYS